MKKTKATVSFTVITMLISLLIIQSNANAFSLFISHKENYRELANHYAEMYKTFIEQYNNAKKAPPHKKLNYYSYSIAAGDKVLRDYASRNRKGKYYVFLPEDYKIKTIHGVMTHRQMKEKVFAMLNGMTKMKFTGCYKQTIRIQKIWWKRSRRYSKTQVFQTSSKLIPCHRVKRYNRVVRSMEKWHQYLRKTASTDYVPVGYRDQIKNGEKIYVHADGRKFRVNYRNKIIYYWNMTVYAVANNRTPFSNMTAKDRKDYAHSFYYMKKAGKVKIRQGKAKEVPQEYLAQAEKI